MPAAADEAPALSPDSAAAVDAVEALPDGVRLAELVEALPLSRGSVFELVKALGIITAKGPGPGGKGRVAWLTGADADRVRRAAHEVAAGRLRIADVGGMVHRPQTPPTLATLQEAPSPDSAAAADPAALLQRMEAADRALRTGFPLTTAEVALILGVRPGGPVVARAGIVAHRIARNVWRLAAASPDSPDPAEP